MNTFKVVIASAIALHALFFASVNHGQVSPRSDRASTAGERTQALDSGIVPGRLIQRTDPKYPEERSQEKMKGAVELEATIDKDGRITNLAINSGDLVLADAAIDAVRQWKFEPYTKDSNPIQVWQKLIFNFNAEQKSIELDAQLPPPTLATSLFHVQRDLSPVTAPAAIRVGHGMSAPKPLVAPDPEYTKAAKKAKYQGNCVLSVLIGTDGQAHDFKVIRAVGLGLDLKAVEAVSKWKFQPGMKDGAPVATYATIELNFRLY